MIRTTLTINEPGCRDSTCQPKHLYVHPAIADRSNATLATQASVVELEGRLEATSKQQGQQEEPKAPEVTPVPALDSRDSEVRDTPQPQLWHR